MTEHLDPTSQVGFSSALPGFSPKALLEAVEDPSVFVELHRAEYYIQVMRMRELMKSQAVKVSERLKWMELCAKYGAIAPKDDESSREQRPMIQIVFDGDEHHSYNARPAIDIAPTSANRESIPTLRPFEDDDE